MKLTIEQQKLHALLSRVQNAVERRNTIPILGHVLLNASGATLTATGTDLEVEVRSTAEAEVKYPGGCTVDISLLMPIVGKLPKGKEVILESDGLQLSIKSGSANLKLNCLPIDDFPSMASDEYAVTVRTSQEEVRRLFDLTAFAMSSEATRYYLNGVYLHSVDGKICAVSTDGHRLAHAVSTVEFDFPSVIVPSKTVGLIRALLEDDGDVTLQATEGQKIQLDVGHSVITSKIIDGAFPDYTRVIPKSNENSVTFNAYEAKTAIGLVQLISQQKTRAVRLDIKDGSLGFYVQDQSAGEGCERVDAEISGEFVSIGVNGKYALDCLALADKGDVTIKYGGPLDTLLVTYDSEPDFLAVIMPMRV